MGLRSHRGLDPVAFPGPRRHARKLFWTGVIDELEWARPPPFRKVSSSMTPSRSATAPSHLKLWTLVTPSHERLLADWFLRTLPTDCHPVVNRLGAEPAEYGRGHWHRVVAHKFDVLECAFATEPADSVFVMSDVDIRFYSAFAEDVRQRIEGRDVLFQNNRPGVSHRHNHICTGFMVVRCCERARSFFERARAILWAANDPLTGDQGSCIQALEENPEFIRYALLPDTYWAPVRSGVHWQPGNPLAPPRDIVLHHANKTIGNANKIAQLSTVERLVQDSRVLTHFES